MTYLAMLLVVALAQTPPARDSASNLPTPKGTAVLSGIVVVEDGGAKRPLRRAIVTVAGTGIPRSRQVATDDAGRFAFRELPGGRFTLTAEKPGYVKTFHGSRRPGRPPSTPLAVADGQRVTDLAITLVRGAVIEGTVRDERGVPIPSAQVRAYQATLVEGERKLTGLFADATSATTDDRGRYRLYGLAPGEYTVTAGGGAGLGQNTQQVTENEIAAALRELRGGGVGAAGGAPAKIDAPAVTRGIVYFPGVSDAMTAQVFPLGAGEERLGVDVVNPLVRSAKIEMTILGPNGQPLTNVMIGIANASTKSMYTSPGMVRPNAEGRFTLPGLLPGQYLFFGRGGELGVEGTPMPYWISTEVRVDGNDVPGIVLQLMPGRRVTGALTFLGGRAPAAVAGIRLALTQVAPIPGTVYASPVTQASADGSFAFADVQPGKYRVTLPSLAGWSLQSAISNGRDTLDVPLDVSAGEDVAGLAITLTDQPTEISGTILDQLGRPSPEYSVVVFPTDRALWTTAPRRLSGLIKVGSDGHYRVTGLPAGDYQLAVVTDAEASQLSDPTFLEQLAAASVKLTLTDGQKKIQDLKLGG